MLAMSTMSGRPEDQRQRELWQLCRQTTRRKGQVEATKREFKYCTGAKETLYLIPVFPSLFDRQEGDSLHKIRKHRRFGETRVTGILFVTSPRCLVSSWRLKIKAE